MTRDRQWTLQDLPDDIVLEGVRGLRTSEIGVVFQPIVDIATGRAFAHEALVRCKRPEYASPVVLFDHAVKEGACGRLGRMIRDVTFATCGDVPVFVNLHPDELASRWLVRPDEPIGFHSRPVFLEVTETAALTHFELCSSVLKEVRERTSALLVIDDFGAGYSNLARVADFEPDVVKLDLTLTHNVHMQKRKQLVVKHMVNLCVDLGARIVAEGVETLDELKCVRDLGVHYAQGFLLARPAHQPPSHVWPLPGKAPPLPKTAVSQPRAAPPTKPPSVPPSTASRRPKPPSRRPSKSHVK